MMEVSCDIGRFREELARIPSINSDDAKRMVEQLRAEIEAAGDALLREPALQYTANDGASEQWREVVASWHDAKMRVLTNVSPVAVKTTRRPYVRVPGGLLTLALEDFPED